MSENTDSIVAKFQTLGTDAIEDQAGARNIIIEVCKAYPDKHFTQREFKDNLATHQHDGRKDSVTLTSTAYSKSLLMMVY